MPSATSKLVSEIVDYQIAIEDIASAKVAWIQSRFAQLLKEPAQVIDELTFQFLKSEMSGTDLPADFWDVVADGQQWTFDEFHAVPFNDRGEAWEMARQIRVAVAQRQAILESGILIDAMRRGVDFGAVQASLLDDLDLAELQANNNFKTLIKEKRAASENVV